MRKNNLQGVNNLTAVKRRAIQMMMMIHKTPGSFSSIPTCKYLRQYDDERHGEVIADQSQCENEWARSGTAGGSCSVLRY